MPIYGYSKAEDESFAKQLYKSGINGRNSLHRGEPAQKHRGRHFGFNQLVGQSRRPGRIGGEGRSLDPLFVASCKIDAPQLRATAGTGNISKEHQNPPIRRPGRSLIVKPLGQDPLTAAIRFHNADQPFSRHLFGERNQIASWRPNRRRVFAALETNS